jgi:hypothetical protein
MPKYEVIIYWREEDKAFIAIPEKFRRSRVHLRSVEERVEVFHQMLERQRQREINPPSPEEWNDPAERPSLHHDIERGWRREDLYTRGLSR